MNFDYTDIGRAMIDDRLLNKKVVRARDARLEEEPEFGHVVSGNQQTGMIWVVWRPMSDPTRHSVADLFLVKEEMRLTKTMKFSGKTLGALEKFVEQVQVEGGSYETVLNPGKVEHIAIVVELPLATERPDRIELKADDRVVASYPTAIDLVDGRKPGMD